MAESTIAGINEMIDGIMLASDLMVSTKVSVKYNSLSQYIQNRYNDVGYKQHDRAGNISSKRLCESALLLGMLLSLPSHIITRVSLLQ